MVVLVSMDKVALNYQIVKMRKLVDRAKIQVIRKLIRKIRILEKKSKNGTFGNEKYVAGTKNRTRRIEEDIAATKKLSRDTVSKFALENKMELSNSMSNGLKLTATDRALFRLANYPVIVKEVKKFRETYPDWEKELPLLMKVLGIKVKKKKGKLNNNNETLNSQKQKKVPKSENKNLQSKNTLKQDINSPKKKLCKITKKNKFEETDKSVDNKIQDSSQERIVEVKHRKETINEIAEVRQLKLNELNCEEIPKIIDKKTDTVTSNEVTQTPSSSFFLGNNGETLEESSEHKTLPENTKPHHSSLRLNKNLNRRQRRNLLLGRDINYTSWQDDKPEAKNLKKSQNNKFDSSHSEESHKAESKRNNEKEVIQGEESLHPSWAAKKQQKAVVTQFLGKKMKFDDDE